jgi:hypothetical protein
MPWLQEISCKSRLGLDIGDVSSSDWLTPVFFVPVLEQFNFAKVRVLTKE